MMDVGRSLNPAVDIGQVEGAFVQGLGLFTMEEQLFSTDGTLLTRGPGLFQLSYSLVIFQARTKFPASEIFLLNCQSRSMTSGATGMVCTTRRPLVSRPFSWEHQSFSPFVMRSKRLTQSNVKSASLCLSTPRPQLRTFECLLTTNCPKLHKRLPATPINPGAFDRDFMIIISPVKYIFISDFIIG